jgi:hypothetical protein
MTWLAFALVALIAATPLAAQETPMTEEELIELVRTDLQKDKVAIIGAAMDFSAEEAGKFWPIYKDYESALAKVGDERLALIKDYAANFSSMTDTKANELAMRAMELEQQRFGLKKKAFEKLAEGVSPVVAARFLQVENQLGLIMDLKIAQQLPLIEKP